jgi:IclR family acetate operon transcriptional repressor
MRADAIAQAVNLPLSTTYRYLQALRREGFVERCSAGVYGLGAVLPRAAWNQALRVHLHRLAEPILFTLARKTGETIYLAVPVGQFALVLDRVEFGFWRRRALPRGAVQLLHKGAAGRALLAFAGESVIRAVLEDLMLRGEERERFERGLAEIRSSRLSVSDGEIRRGVSGIAMPVLRDGVAVCAICVAGPTLRLKEAMPRICGLLRSAVQELEERLCAYPRAWVPEDPSGMGLQRRGGRV